MGHSVNAAICLILSLEALVGVAFQQGCIRPSFLSRRSSSSSCSSSSSTTTTSLFTLGHHNETVAAGQKSQSPSPAISAAQTPNTSSRANLKVRRLLQRILERLEDRDNIASAAASASPLPLQNWTKTRKYLYRSSHRLSLDQIDRVLNFLREIFPHDRDLQRWIVQESPRILRKNCETKLRPTVQLLQSLYGNDMLKQAVRRNPDLLLARGMGFDLDSNSLELNHIFLKQELGLTETKLEKVKERLPAIFQAPVSKLLSVIHFYRYYLLQNLDDDVGGIAKANQAIGKLLVAHPQIFLLSVEQGLRPRIEFLQERCQWNDADVGALIQSSSAGAVLGLSVKDNLQPTLDFLSQRLEPEQLSRTVKVHPQLLGLSLGNLQAKVSYFDSIEESCSQSRASRGMLGSRQLTDSLASRMLIRSPTVFSLSLKDNIVPKVQFLAGIWGVQSPVCDLKSNKLVFSAAEPEKDSLFTLSPPSLAQHLRQYPSVLALSLEGNLRPTIEFYNRTGYVSLDSDWKLNTIKDNDVDRQHTLRGREIAASLWSRLLPRWHFVATTIEHTDDEEADSKDAITQKALLPLHVLVSANDLAFCKAMGLDIEAYRIFKKEEIPRLKFSSQFNTWLKTGRPIDI